jgi:acetyl esterase/lipase
VPSLFADEALTQYMARSASGPLSELSVEAMRAGTAGRVAARPRGPDMHEVRDLRVAGLGLGARLYRPTPAGGPLLVYFHGGGWTIGSLDTHDRACRRLAAGSEAAVLSIDYRLAPEHPWPASVDDAVGSVRWAAQNTAELHVDGAIGVGGDSAGGTLAALACLRLRDEHPEALPHAQVLICANTDLTGAHPSMREKATGWGLEARAVRFFNSQWVPDERRWSDPGVSPLHAPDLRGLPSAVVITAEHDVLRDEGEAYAERLREAGVPVRARREPGLVHGFIQFDDISPACAQAVDRLAADVRACLDSG